MEQEIKALEENYTWDIVDLPEGKEAIRSNGYIRLNTSPMVR